MRRRHSPEQVIRDLIREFDASAGITKWSQLIPFIAASEPETQQDTYDDGEMEFDDTPGGRVRDASLDAVIIGDSQSGGQLGRTIKARLEEMGYSVRKTHKDGASGDEILRDQMPDITRMPDLLVVIFGGNDFSVQGAVDAAKEMYEATSGAGTYLIIVGPPQATTITDPAGAGEAFAGSLGPTPEPNAWFTRDGGTYVERRFDIAQALEEEFAGLPNVSVYGIGAHMIPIGGLGSGETYPDQPDGLHLSVGADRVVDNILRAVDITEITQDLRDKMKPAAAPDYGPIEDFDYMRWREEIADLEGDYDSVNPDSKALGRYQFVPSIWWNKIKEFAEDQGKSLDSYDDYLDDHKLQDDFMYYYTVNNVLPAVARLRRRNPELTAGLSDGKLAGLVHFQGEGGGEKWLRSGVMVGADINSIDPTGYMRRVT